MSRTKFGNSFFSHFFNSVYITVTFLCNINKHGNSGLFTDTAVLKTESKNILRFYGIIGYISRLATKQQRLEH